MLRLEVLPSSWSPMQDCTSIEGLTSVELDTLIVARWAHGLVPLFYLAILRHLCWMYWLLSSYCGLVCSSDVLLTSKVQEYTITMENPAILGSRSPRQLLEVSPSLARCELSSVVFGWSNPGYWQRAANISRRCLPQTRQVFLTESGESNEFP